MPPADRALKRRPSLFRSGLGDNLVIKVGAAGDVLRTTPILHVLQGPVDWVTDRAHKELVPRHPKIRSITEIDEAPESLSSRDYDLVLSLDDEHKPARLASLVKAKRVVGAHLEKGQVAYTAEARPWFDMGLLSRLGKSKADQLKLENRKTYQQILFGMLGHEFHGEPYVIDRPQGGPSPDPRRVGFELRSGERWPSKRWNGFDDLERLLRKSGFNVVRFEKRSTMGEFIRDVSACGCVVSGDTLALHIALALGIGVVGIFICTSPWEVHDYGLMRRIVSPRLAEAFYRTAYMPEAVGAISVQEVFSELMSLMAVRGPRTS